MTTDASPAFLTLSQVAARTGRHPELLRQWCAAGRIPCRRLGGSWVVLEEDLPLLGRMATRRRRRTDNLPRSGRRRILVAVFEDRSRAAEAATALRARLGLDDGATETGPIGVGALAALGLTVAAGTVPEEMVLDARRILASYGGRIMADLEGDPPAPVRRRTQARSAAASP